MNSSQLAVLAAALAALATLPGAQAATGGAVQSVAINYTPNPFGEGVILAGPLDKPVFYTQRVHLKKGGLVPPHTHPDTRYTTVLSGTLYVCTGDKVSPDAVTAFPAGSFIITPANVVHCSWAKDGDVVYQESGIGPTATNLLKK
jgi:quercetin dioxygenase-like cupin family protein